MKTLILKKDQIEQAANFIKKGELVSFPTETVYGLGADATKQELQRYLGQRHHMVLRRAVSKLIRALVLKVWKVPRQCSDNSPTPILAQAGSKSKNLALGWQSVRYLLFLKLCLRVGL